MNDYPEVKEHSGERVKLAAVGKHSYGPKALRHRLATGCRWRLGRSLPVNSTALFNPIFEDLAQK